MSDADYAVVFRGALAADADAAAVKQKLARMLKIGPAQVERLFQGTVVIKKGLSQADAERIAGTLLQRAGARMEVVRLRAASAPKAPRADGAPKGDPEPAVMPEPEVVVSVARQADTTPPPPRDAVPQAVPATPPPGPLTEHALTLAFAGGIAAPAPGLSPVRATALAVLLAAVPLAYLLAVAGVVALSAWYAASGALTAASNPLLTALAYLPLAASALLLVFLLKPVLVRGAAARQAVALTRDVQPRLFAFLDTIADKAAAPRPHSVEVDGSVAVHVGYGRGWRGLRGDELVVRIGLPLLAGMDTRQLATAVARGYAPHGAQPAARAAYLVRRVNYELYRAAEERDVWDERLERWAEDGGRVASAVAGLALHGVAVTRAALGAIGAVSMRLSAGTLRDMDFAADAFGAALTGSAAFRAAALRQRHLQWGLDACLQDIAAAWSPEQGEPGTLSDDIPAAIARAADTFQDAPANRVDYAWGGTLGDAFGGHPPDAERVAAAEALGAAGVFTLDRPALDLLAEPTGLAREVTLRTYRHLLGVELAAEDLTAGARAAGDQGRQLEQVLNDYFRNLLLPGRYAAVPRVDASDDASRRMELTLLVRRIRRGLPDLAAPREQCLRAQDQLPAAFAAQALAQHADPALQQQLRNLAPLGHDALQAELQRLRAELASAQALMMRRLGLALAGACEWSELAPEERSRLALGARVTRALAAAQGLRDELHLAAGAVKFACQGGAAGASLTVWCGRTERCAQDLQAALQRLPNPLAGARSGSTVWEHLSTRLPARGETPQKQVAYVEAMIGELDAVYRGLMAQLAEAAQRYELHLGVEPLGIRIAPAAVAAAAG